MPRINDPAERKRRDAEIWRLYAAGWTLVRLGERFDLAHSRVSEIITRERGRFSILDKALKREELAAQLDDLRSAAQELVDAEPAPMFRGAEPIVDRDDDGEVVKRYYDHGGRLEAMKTVVAIQAREAKMLGLDAPDQIQTDSTVKYVVEGVDMEDLR
ncbi:MAG TPA: hypothetical protein VFB74_34025 [Kribbellaceae bacterium]|nr:hypothetical protein [Kribbellaceae bacterium]